MTARAVALRLFLHHAGAAACRRTDDRLSGPQGHTRDGWSTHTLFTSQLGSPLCRGWLRRFSHVPCSHPWREHDDPAVVGVLPAPSIPCVLVDKTPDADKGLKIAFLAALAQLMDWRPSTQYQGP